MPSPDDRKLPRDPTPSAGAPGDVAAVSRGTSHPASGQTAHKDPDAGHWERIAAADEFKALLRAKRRFIIPATIFFVLYYFALPYLVGYHTAFMQRKVWGEVNLAYLFALSQFFMAWGLATIYVVVANGWDRTAAELILKFRR
ncbi:MAG: DUF485 domain-containing protein [Verrucomicrobiota bacterium]|nr:DUF485 domain-containing protein [Verrucomicrobiota bacterium]